MNMKTIPMAASNNTASNATNMATPRSLRFRTVLVTFISCSSGLILSRLADLGRAYHVDLNGFMRCKVIGCALSRQIDADRLNRLQGQLFCAGTPLVSLPSKRPPVGGEPVVVRLPAASATAVPLTS